MQAQINDKDGQPILVPVVELAAPVYDPSTHRLERIEVVYEDRVEWGYAAIPLTGKPGPRTVSPTAFRDRFTVAEMDAILALAYGGDAVARRLLFKLQTQTSIHLDSSELSSGLDYLVSVAVLTSARAVEVSA